MNKKTKTSLILSSAAAILLAGSIMAGGTYALFTSESKTNIAVTSGTVNVSATIDSLEAHTPTLIDSDGTVSNDTELATKVVEGNEWTFGNGGTAILSGQELKLDKMTPGDSASFKINVKNYSNVKTKYRTKIEVSNDTGLFEGLEVTIGGEEMYYWSDWAELDAANAEEGDSVAAIECSVKLPTTAGNRYQDKSCDIAFIVEAVQGNAKVQDPTYIASVESANTAMDNGDSELVIQNFTAEVDYSNKTGTGKDRAALHFNNVEHPNMADTITISGNGTVTTNEMAIWAQYGANIVVNSGTYISSGGSNGKVQLIYANNDSVMTINGGTFINKGTGTAEIFNTSKQDNGYGGTIIIKGGLYNKELVAGKAWPVNDDYGIKNGVTTGIKIADGYKSVEEVIDGVTWYRVVKDTSSD